VILLACVTGDSRAESSTSLGIPPFSFSCELGGPAASLLGTGVKFLMVDFLNTGFVIIGTNGFEALTLLDVSLASETPLDEVGVPLPARFVKKLAMLRCPFCEPALEACFFNEGGGRDGVAVEESFGFPILGDMKNTGELNSCSERTIPIERVDGMRDSEIQARTTRFP
jgi:hypothetical protein